VYDKSGNKLRRERYRYGSKEKEKWEKGEKSKTKEILIYEYDSKGRLVKESKEHGSVRSTYKYEREGDYEKTVETSKPPFWPETKEPIPDKRIITLVKVDKDKRPIEIKKTTYVGKHKTDSSEKRFTYNSEGKLTRSIAISTGFRMIHSEGKISLCPSDKSLVTESYKYDPQGRLISRSEKHLSEWKNPEGKPHVYEVEIITEYQYQ